MGNFSKIIGSLVGGGFGLLVTVFGLPAEYATLEIQGAIIILFSSAFTFFFPANKPAG